jgi:hypothetical protein
LWLQSVDVNGRRAVPEAEVGRGKFSKLVVAACVGAVVIARLGHLLLWYAQ